MTRPTRAVVVGLGSPDRGDDGVGPMVAARVADVLAQGGPADVLVVVHEDPTALVDLMDGVRVMVVVDAVRSGADPGTVATLRAGSGDPSLAARTSTGPAGTHGLGLAGILELARALDRLPPHLAIVGVEAGCFDHGAPVSAAVLGAVPDAVRAVLAELGATVGAGPAGPAPGDRRWADVP